MSEPQLTFIFLFETLDWLVVTGAWLSYFSRTPGNLRSPSDELIFVRRVEITNQWRMEDHPTEPRALGLVRWAIFLLGCPLEKKKKTLVDAEGRCRLWLEDDNSILYFPIFLIHFILPIISLFLWTYYQSFLPEGWVSRWLSGWEPRFLVPDNDDEHVHAKWSSLRAEWVTWQSGCCRAMPRGRSI